MDPNNGTLSIIDEPEISLHPSWQIKILDFYKSILDLKNKKDNSQLIVATHSPFIIHNHNRADDKIIVLDHNADGEIEVLPEPSFYGWSAKEAIQGAFELPEELTGGSPLILVEGITDEKYIRAAASALDFNLQGSEIQWVGRVNKNGSPEFTGDSALNQTFLFAQSNPEAINRPLVLLYDNDTNKNELNGNRIYVRTMPLIDTNNTMTKGIENLLTLPPNIQMDEFYTENSSPDGYGGFTTKKKLNKNKLCDYLIEGTKKGDFTGVFTNFSGVFEKIEEILNLTNHN
ncbi:AAA family ATPase [Microbulbifer sp. VAAF005]|uniref:AAA family ATPase n=1 Tax=Microbulbifer sp. VAAF005 TaxID=3034230 RepID=UPI0024AD61D4|nr:AAA family ATPase [Microbulbifer sp. VAAF005]WHI49153.1 AAA family ATPase [Microbulbifer sp. VAAF005]